MVAGKVGRPHVAILKLATRCFRPRQAGTRFVAVSTTETSMLACWRPPTPPPSRAVLTCRAYRTALQSHEASNCQRLHHLSSFPILAYGTPTLTINFPWPLPHRCRPIHHKNTNPFCIIGGLHPTPTVSKLPQPIHCC